VIEQIKQLETVSRQLHLQGEQRTDLFDRVIQYAGQYLDSIKTAPAYQAPPENNSFKIDAAISETGIDIEQILKHMADDVDSVGINPTSGRFIGYIPGGALPLSALGDFLAAISNRYAGVYHASPGAVTIENSLLDWMAEILDYPETASGYLSSGGSIANLTAIVTARDAYEISGNKISRSVVYMTEHVHHCIDKALHIAGLRDCIRRNIAVDDNYRMNPDALSEQIQADRAEGLNPFLVIASAGTTNTGSVDPLEAIGQIAESEGVWYHIDGAYGGLFKLCPEGQIALKGTAYSDSMVVDPHKTLFLPYGTGAVLVKDARKQFAAFNAHADYMEFVNDNDVLSSADLSPELTKHFRGLRLWLPLKLLGTEIFKAALSEKILLARYFHEKMQSVPGFEVGCFPDLSVVTYRYLPERGDANDFNERLMKAVLDEGQVYLSSTRLNGDLVLRAAIMSFRTHIDEVETVIDRLQYHAKQLLI